MLKIGNIVYKDELVNHVKVNNINYYYNINGEFDDYNEELPTLFVGWNLMKLKFNNDDLSILNKKYIKNKKYWEFSFNENKSQHVTGIDMFVRNVPYYYFRNIYTYKNLDPIFNNIKSIYDIKNIIPNNIDYTYNYKNEILYFLSKNIIYGIDLEMYGFFNIYKEEIYDMIISETKSYTLDLEGKIYQKEYKNYPNFEQLKRYLVVLLLKG